MQCSRVFRIVLLAGLAACGSVSNDPDANLGDDDAPSADAAPSVCGDGRRDPGEVCYGEAIVTVGSDVTYDGQLADVDGDGDLDLAYLIGDLFLYHLQNDGNFAGSPLAGPTTLSRYLRLNDFDDNGENELVAIGNGVFEIWVRGAGGNYNLISTAGAAGVDQGPTGLALGNVTGGQYSDIIALFPDGLQIGRLDPNLEVQGVQAMVGARGVAVGALDSDAFDDIVVAAAGGVRAFRGVEGGVSSFITTPRDNPTDGVAIGDVDADGINDLVFVVAEASGTLGVMIGVGSVAYQNPTTQSIPSLQRAVVTADIDGDGRADAIAGGNHQVLVALGQADGTLAAPIALPIAAAVDDLHADADYNGDGVPDLVTTDFTTQTLIILPSNP